MELTIRQNIDAKNNYRYNQSFQGPLDGALTTVFRTLDTNEMANAVLLDLGAMVAPRTYIDTKERNKYAGAETFFREISGTFINCLSAGLFAGLISRVAAKTVQPEIKVNPKSWFSDDALNLLSKAWDNSGNNTTKYVQNVLDNISAVDGKNVNKLKDLNWNSVEWFSENKLNNHKWQNPEYANIAENLKTKDGFVENFVKVINDKNLAKSDKKAILEIMEARLTNVLKAERDVKVQIGETKMSGTLKNILRDTFDMGKDVFGNNKANAEAILGKIAKINKIKIFGALAMSSALGLTNQYINRKITEKRTGKKGFVGETNYMSSDDTVKKVDDKKALWMKKILASAGMIAMTVGVMRVKNPKDFIQKLQFTGPVTSGNAIKTVYASTIVGRFLAADSSTELRESVVRDYFGFLNWLVLGGFASKGVANLLDKNRENLFNVNKGGKGIKHWLNDLSLKTHAEIASKGQDFAKKNLWKLNTAHFAGLAYSTIALGILLPLINIKMTNKGEGVKG